ncbi:MAG TPA: hypothetical protein VE954_08750 [Oligoflexus sp.]|uniref:hypothetical protein n=1 Tax=Oligoflexus sp. TaxID=1971216 RepID=UPI002D50DB85|nr:hypothetical protein [Oligoflexus sp.]HYX33191.1 hypothetical protein [Oligoflexus sp.]
MKFLWILIALITCQSAFSQEMTKEELDLKQAALTKQLNVAEKIGEIHGSYRIVRDIYFTGPKSVNVRVEKHYADVSRWLENWIAILSKMNNQNWLSYLESPELKTALNQQAHLLKEIEFEYAGIGIAANEGLDRIKGLPKLDLKEFETQASAGNEAVFLHRYSANLIYVNEQMDFLKTRFSASLDALHPSNGGNVVDLLKNLQRGIADKIKLISTIRKLEFPELKGRIEAVERMLATDKAVEPALTRAVNYYKEGEMHLSNADYLGAEKTLAAFKRSLDRDFRRFEDSAVYAQDRVKQAKALAQANYNALEASLKNGFGSFGGREHALRYFITQKSYKQRGATPLKTCREQNGQLGQHRHFYDCNLFRANVLPFLTRLNEVEEGLLEVIANQLKAVYQGPLSEKGT